MCTSELFLERCMIHACNFICEAKFQMSEISCPHIYIVHGPGKTMKMEFMMMRKNFFCNVELASINAVPFPLDELTSDPTSNRTSKHTCLFLLAAHVVAVQKLLSQIFKSAPELIRCFVSTLQHALEPLIKNRLWR